MSVTRNAVNVVNTCKCVNNRTSLWQKYKNIGIMREEGRAGFIGNEGALKVAQKQDNFIKGGIIIGSVLIGGGLGMKYMYNEIRNEESFTMSKGGQKSALLFGYSIGGTIGFCVGGLISVIYPYPGLFLGCVSTGIFGGFGTKYLSNKLDKVIKKRS